MEIKDIIVCIANARADTSAIEMGHQIARDHNAHIACSAIGIFQTPLVYNEFGIGAARVAFLQEEKDQIEQFWDDIRAHLDKRSEQTELRRHKTYGANLEPLVAAIVRHSDLAVIRAPADLQFQPYSQFIEAALLGSGRPVLVAPVSWKPGPLGRKIVMGWDASGPAARAMHDALLLAAKDAEVTVVTVGAKAGSTDHGDAPGLDIAAHLARHGLKVELRNEANLGRPVHQVLMQVATDTDADLLVLGGYRHSRLQQTLFGGVTRSILNDPGLPLLLSH